MALKWLSHGSQRGKWLDPAFLWYTWAFPRGLCCHLALPFKESVCIFLGPGDNQLLFVGSLTLPTKLERAGEMT